MKVLLIASTGGHLAQLIELRPWWQHHQRHWITFDKEDARAGLKGENVTYAYHPTTRNIPNAVRNGALAAGFLLRHRPNVIVSTGAGVAVPFFVMAKALGIRTAFLEVYDRITMPTLSGRMVYPLCDTFLVQWPEQQQSYPDSTLVGTVY